VCLPSRNEIGLTQPFRTGNLGSMAQTLQRLDPDRRRRRLRLLAELADAKAVRARVAPRQAYVNRVRDLIATRRRSAGWT
jgi:hypothetical protein